MNALALYPWPGNVRELSHVMERACVLCEGSTISLEHFPDEIRSQQMPQKTITALTPTDSFLEGQQDTTTVVNASINYISEKDELIDALRRARGNKSKAARILNIDRSTLYRKMQRQGIEPDEFA
jgi:transcriptional regulator of acetoin/glycerol metabolism